MNGAWKILIIDDDRQLLHSLAFTFQRQGFIVETQADQDRAIAILSQRTPDGNRPYDLVITDVRIPGINGFKIIDSTRASGIDIPFVVMHSFSEGRVIEECTARGVKAILAKPFTWYELVRKIKSVLESGSTS
jgi:DNA-binding response OmpR family regulator